MRRLSGGQRRRLDLALALAGDPDLIFLDEPTTGFDPESRRRCWAAIENLRALGKTIVLTTHYLDEAERLADRVAILQDGRIQVAGTVRHVASQAGVKTKIKFAAPERVLDGTLAPPRCLDVVVSGEVAVCQTENSATALRELLGWAAANDLGDLDDLSVETPTLEDAYLQLVNGRLTTLSRTVSLAFRQAVLEQRSFWRSAEYALFTFALPLALLLLIGSTTAGGYLPGTHVEGQMIFVPSIIAFGVIVAAYVNLGAKLATLRHDGVLKRIRTTPLPASAYLSGVLASTAATTLAITASIWPSARSPSARYRARAACRRSPAASSSASSASARSASRSARSRAAPSRRHRSPTPATSRWRSCPASSTRRSPSRTGCRRPSGCSRSARSPRSSSRATPRSPTPR